jgi:hypothetical protein
MKHSSYIISGFEFQLCNGQFFRNEALSGDTGRVNDEVKKWSRCIDLFDKCSVEVAR